MVPYNSFRDSGLDLNRDNRKLERHTGLDKFWKHKKEVKTLFEPMANLTHINGMPVHTQKIKNRYNPSYKKRNQELPNSRQNVAPGLNGKIQDGLYNTDRILPRSNNELRVLNNQRQTYQGKMIHSGLRGQKGEQQSRITSFKKPDFREQSFGDFVKHSASVKGRTIYGKFRNSNTNRTTSVHYAGHAANETKGNKYNPDNNAYTEPSRTTYHIEPNNVGSINKKYLFNKDAFPNRPTIRSTTNQDQTGNPFKEGFGNYTHNGQIAKRTIGETTQYSYEGNPIADRGNYFRNFDKAKKTVGETTQFAYEGNPNAQIEVTTLGITIELKRQLGKLWIIFL